MHEPAASTAGPPQATNKPRKVRGTVYINASRCKGCGFCIAFCPPKVLEFAEEFNAAGYHPPRLANPDGCTGCDLCGLYCPDFAIYGVMLKYSSAARQGAPAPGQAEPSGPEATI